MRRPRVKAQGAPAPATSTHAAAGFTLLELMVAIVAVTLMSGIVYAGFATVVDTGQMARDNAERLRVRQLLWRSFSTNLSSVYVDPAIENPSYEFLGEDNDQQDVLQFVTSLPMPGANALPGVLRTVRYEVLTESEADAESSDDEFTIDEYFDEEKEELLLRITESALSTGEESLGEFTGQYENATVERSVSVGSMDIKYYDGEEEDWVDEWSSMTTFRLLWAVHIKINFAKTEDEIAGDAALGIDPEEEPDLNFYLAIPVGAGSVAAFPDVNHFWPSELDLEGLGRIAPGQSLDGRRR